METSLMNLLCSTPSCQIQPGTNPAQGKSSGGSSFSSLLQGSLGRGYGAPRCGTASEGVSHTGNLPSDDALSRSLDVIGALAFLPVLLTAQPQVTDAAADFRTGLFSVDALNDLLDAIANALETGDMEGLRKTLGENKNLQDLLSGQGMGNANLLPGEGSDSSDSAAKTGQTNSSVSNDVASLIAALDALHSGASLPAPENGTQGSASPEGKSSALREGSEKADAGSAAAGNDDTVRNAALLGAILPSLLAATQDTATNDSARPEGSSTEISSGLISSVAQDRAYKGAGFKGNGTTSRTGSGKGENQQDDANSLSEDYVLLNAAKTDRTSETVPAPGNIFEILKARAEGSSDAAGNGERASTPPNGAIQNQRLNTAGAGDIPAEQITQAAAHLPENQGEAGKAAQPAESTALTAEEVVADLRSRKEKSSHGDESSGGPDTSDKTNVLVHDSTKTTTSSQKTAHTAQAAASQASTMVHKIEELAESYSSRNQSMDMVLRLKVDEKESLVVGLRSQGDRVLVDVKGASDGLLSALQSQKDFITRELESKQIYTTINVEINGDGNPGGRDQRQRQDRNGKEDNETDFGGIFNTLT